MNWLRRAGSDLRNMYPNTMNEQLHDAFEIYFSHSLPIRVVYLAITIILLLAFRLRTRVFRGKLLVNERIVEYPQVLRWISTGGTVLDIGCASSRLPMQLASLGYEVHGLDLRLYPFEHPNLHFHQDSLFSWNPQRTFDTILLISTLEHLGLGVYGDSVMPNADQEAIGRIAKWLSPRGRLLVSVPFGKAGSTTMHRVYDGEQLRNLFSAFKWSDSKYYRRISGHWMPSSAAELAGVESPGRPPNGVALLCLEAA
jgi:SAM-dependent methyltransferase